MTNSEALKILKDYQCWRRDLPDKDGNSVFMPHPKLIGIALDIAIKSLEEQLSVLTDQRDDLQDDKHRLLQAVRKTLETLDNPVLYDQLHELLTEMEET